MPDLPRTSLSRRHFALGAAALLGLAACRPTSDPDLPTGPVPSTESTAEFPVTVEHGYGTTTVEEQPTRIVTLGLSDQDPLLALGVAPIAVYPWFGDYPSATWPWAQDELGATEPVVLNGGVRDESNPPLEEIAALAPDLILSLYNGTTQEQYDQLSKIAPTVVPAKDFLNFTITWQEATRAVGAALGREGEALTLVTELEESFADAAAAHPEFAGKVAVVAERFKPGETVVRTGNDVRAQFFELLGFTIPTDLAGNKPNEYGELYLPDELITELSQDLLVWNVGFSPEARDTVEGIALYPNLPAVKENRVLWVEDELTSGAFSWGTVLSLHHALDTLLPQIADLVD